MARQRPTRLVMGPCIVEIDCTVIREVHYQLEVNRRRNEEIIVKGNFSWAWPMWAGRPRVGNGAMHMNRCTNEEIIVKVNFGWAWPMWAGRPRINRIVIRDVQYQFEVNLLKGNFGWAWPMWAGRPKEEVQYQFEENRCSSANNDGQTDIQTAEITTKPAGGEGGVFSAFQRFKLLTCLL
ncbi:hypothetical protein DPMN_168425 [Dreissena polymorpha]|uniref:Uncharacterized protein n=1 Tax=Dreissena polymorpha TaxID=45954 RepID=A0A9D4F2Q3_DREPO|nr:hypothetical protein DPMN_168425 [Dreissena polymorpha]